MNKIDSNTLSGLDLEQKRQEVLANNLASASVPGYKNEFLVSSPFKKELDSQSNLGGVGSGKIKIDFRQGELKRTDRQLDFAISGEGFFKVRSSDNKDMYTRNGAFRVDNTLRLITDQGFAVLDDGGGEIRFSPEDNLDRLQANPDGTLQIMGNGQQKYAMRTIAKLNVTQIENKDDLDRLSGSYFQVKKDKAVKPFEKPQDFTVSNASLEESNVSPIKTMTMLIESSREFEMGSRLMRMMVELNARELQTFGQG